MEIEGAWIRICCKLWWSEKRGELKRDIFQWAKILRVFEQDAKRILDYIKKWEIGDVVTDGNGSVTVISRRMKRDEKDRELNMLRQRRFKEKAKGNGSVTPPVTVKSQLSSSSSSSSSSNKEKKYIKKSDDFEWIETLRSNPAFKEIDIDRELSKMDAWLSTKPQKKKTRRFIVNWLNRIEKSVSPLDDDPYSNLEIVRAKDGSKN